MILNTHVLVYLSSLHQLVKLSTFIHFKPPPPPNAAAPRRPRPPSAPGAAVGERGECQQPDGRPKAAWVQRGLIHL